MSNYLSPDPVVSGVAYAVVDVDGRTPTTIDDFAGAVAVTLRGATGDHVARGESVVIGEGARLHEKSEDGIGKDTRVWQIDADGDGFAAVST